ncbi:MAG: aldo/keto reductase [Bryobacteraceae bacterium]|nr:aldo/keto reductase [Bryobacteraceae bacterium]
MPASRREFLDYSLRTALAAAIAAKADAAPPATSGEWRNRQSGIAYRRFGRTGFMISEMVMGGNTISPTNHDQVLWALDHGLNYLDTAPAYGNTASEKGYSHIIKARKRDSFFLNTKVSLWDINRSRLYRDIFQSLSQPEQNKLKSKAKDELERTRALHRDYYGHYFPAQVDEMEQSALANVMEQKYGRAIDRGKNYRQLIIDSLDESLKRLGTDHVDILMCPHGASNGYELKNYPEIFEAFESVRKSGKARFLGVSAHNDPAGVLEAAVDTGRYDAAMVAYNIVNHAFVDKALQRAHANQLGVIAMKVARPVFNGRNNGTIDPPERVSKIENAVPGPLKIPQKAYAWALRSAYLTAVISEIVNLQIARENLPLAAPKA